MVRGRSGYLEELDGFLQAIVRERALMILQLAVLYAAVGATEHVAHAVPVEAAVAAAAAVRVPARARSRRRRGQQSAEAADERAV